VNKFKPKFQTFRQKKKVQVKVKFPCTHHEGIWGSAGTALLVLNIGPRRSQAVVYTTQPWNISNVFPIYCIQKLQFKS